jgi:RimJ/RimL family protein N-acetyltransferase
MKASRVRLRHTGRVTTLSELWAPFGLRVRCGSLELRAIFDDDIPAIVDLVVAGIHDPAVMPFTIPWTDAPREELPANTAAFFWSQRASFSPSAWSLELVARWNGEIVGVQGLSTVDYPVLRSAETGSWLGRRFQGQGIGTLMRQAICTLAFDHLQADQLTSAAYTDNPASLGVSRKIGYVDNGTFREQRRPSEVAWSRKLLLTRDTFIRPTAEVDVEGVAPLLAAIGLSPTR